MQRRNFLIGSAAALAGAALTRGAWANVPKPYSWDVAPPTDKREDFIKWMVENRGEDPKYLGAALGPLPGRCSPTRMSGTTPTSAPS